LLWRPMAVILRAPGLRTTTVGGVGGGGKTHGDTDKENKHTKTKKKKKTPNKKKKKKQPKKKRGAEGSAEHGNTGRGSKKGATPGPNGASRRPSFVFEPRKGKKKN